ncbi:MAG: endonuclease Q family protein, partial [Desulfobacterales bacterium]|nr:endonuclease Q family protein [Desulfobacterales bacterium]
GQLGFIPPDLPLDAIEISNHMTVDESKSKIQGIDRMPVIKSSDAHSPESIGRSYTNFLIDIPTFNEIRLALKGENGRNVEA